MAFHTNCLTHQRPFTRRQRRSKASIAFHISKLIECINLSSTFIKQYLSNLVNNTRVYYSATLEFRTNMMSYHTFDSLYLIMMI